MLPSENHLENCEVPQARRCLLEFFEHEAGFLPLESSKANKKRYTLQRQKKNGTRKYYDWAGLKERIQGMALAADLSCKNINIEVAGVGESSNKVVLRKQFNKTSTTHACLGGLKNLKKIFEANEGALEASLLNPASRICSTNDSLPPNQPSSTFDFLKVLDKTIRGLKQNSAPVSSKLTPKKLSIADNPKSIVRETADSFSASRHSMSGHPTSCKLLLNCVPTTKDRPKRKIPTQEGVQTDQPPKLKWQPARKREPSPELKKLFGLLRNDSTDSLPKQTSPQDTHNPNATKIPFSNRMHKRSSSLNPKPKLNHQVAGQSSSNTHILHMLDQAIRESQQIEQHSRRVSAELESIKRKLLKGTAEPISHFDSQRLVASSLDTKLQQIMQRRPAIGRLRATPPILTKSPFIA